MTMPMIFILPPPPSPTKSMISEPQAEASEGNPRPITDPEYGLHERASPKNEKFVQIQQDSFSQVKFSLFSIPIHHVSHLRSCGAKNRTSVVSSSGFLRVRSPFISTSMLLWWHALWACYKIMLVRDKVFFGTQHPGGDNYLPWF